MNVHPVHPVEGSPTRITMAKLCAAWLPEHEIPVAVAEQCVQVLARVLVATKDPVVIEQVFAVVNEQLRHHYRRSKHTLDAAFGRMRTVVLIALENDRHHAIWPLAMRLLNVTPAERRAIRGEEQRRVESANAHVFCFRESATKLLLRKLRTSLDEHDGILLLMLESGLRMIEVLALASVEKAVVNTRSDCDWITVCGLAKTRRPDRKLTKPLLTMSFEEFDARLHKVRSSVAAKLAHPVTPDTEPEPGQLLSATVSTADRKAITNLYNHAVNARVHVHLGPHTSHIARKLYGALSYEWYGKKRGVSYNSWLQTVMGHSSIVTSLSYSNVAVVRDNDEEDDDVDDRNDADIAYFAQAGSHPIFLDDVMAKARDTTARARWIKILQRNFHTPKQYVMEADGVIRMTVWCALDLMEKTGRPRAMELAHKVRSALLSGLVPR